MRFIRFAPWKMDTRLLWVEIRSICSGNYLAGAWVPVGESELDRVIANILRPTRDEIAEAPPVVGKQGSRGLFKPGQVPRDSRDKAIGRLLRGADAVPV